jgi:hypothetical protein
MITIDISNGHDPQPDKPSRPRNRLITKIKRFIRKMGLSSRNATENLGCCLKRSTN